jgi:hypothetical protein
MAFLKKIFVNKTLTAEQLFRTADKYIAAEERTS